jgi:hypothetical protein
VTDYKLQSWAIGFKFSAMAGDTYFSSPVYRLAMVPTYPIEPRGSFEEVDRY